MSQTAHKSNTYSKRQLLAQRAQIIKFLRTALEARCYLEVETPQRVYSAGTDVNLDAFTSEGRYLITSPEFHLKRLLSQSFARIFQICHCFRKGELTKLHNPEFTMLEFYAEGMELEGMMAEVEAMIREIAAKVGKNVVEYNGTRCDLHAPWKRLSVDLVFQRYAHWTPSTAFDEDRFYFDLVDKIEQHLGCGQPSILHNYPAPLAMLSKISVENPLIARRFEVYLSGIEIANAFEELNDSIEQRRRFEADLERRRSLNKPLYPIDEKFLAALSNLPPCSGIALGVDRLVMLLTGAQSVGEVIAFPEEEV